MEGYSNKLSYSQLGGSRRSRRTRRTRRTRRMRKHRRTRRTRNTRRTRRTRRTRNTRRTRRTRRTIKQLGGEDFKELQMKIIEKYHKRYNDLNRKNPELTKKYKSNQHSDGIVLHNNYVTCSKHIETIMSTSQNLIELSNGTFDFDDLELEGMCKYDDLYSIEKFFTMEEVKKDISKYLKEKGLLS